MSSEIYRWKVCFKWFIYVISKVDGIETNRKRGRARTDTKRTVIDTPWQIIPIDLNAVNSWRDLMHFKNQIKQMHCYHMRITLTHAYEPGHKITTIRNRLNKHFRTFHIKKSYFKVIFNDFLLLRSDNNFSHCSLPRFVSIEFVCVLQYLSNGMCMVSIFLSLSILPHCK